MAAKNTKAKNTEVESRVVDSAIELAAERLGEEYRGCYGCRYFEVEVQVRSYVSEYMKDNPSPVKRYTDSPVVGNVMMICKNPDHGFPFCGWRSRDGGGIDDG